MRVMVGVGENDMAKILTYFSKRTLCTVRDERWTDAARDDEGCVCFTQYFEKGNNIVISRIHEQVSNAEGGELF